MEFDPPLIPGRFVRRYKRFLVDVELDDGRLVTAHCTNTGSLLGCLIPGARVMLQPASNASRKLPWSWKMVRVGRTWVGVDTQIAVPLVLEAIERSRLVPELAGYEQTWREVPYGLERSRIDALLSRGGAPRRGGRRTLPTDDERVYIEVKNSTLALDGARGAFPDAVTTRGQKHLRELVHVVRSGARAAIVYCCQRADARTFTPAEHIDPAYGRELRAAMDAGVEAYALGARIGPRRVQLTRRLPIEL